jgi:hypothetical protein
MSAFPTLKTGAVAQYPASRALVHTTVAMRFLDGSEQHYRARGASGRQWTINLALLDETEIATLQAFFESAQGRFGSFSFTDPWDGTVYPDCSLGSDEFDIDLEAETQGKLTLTVRENTN